MKIASVAGDTVATATEVAPPVESPRGAVPHERKGAVGARLAPLAVATATLMEFVDSTALSTALPTLARAFQSDPVHLKLALTSYLLALAVFAPASGWAADRFGARRVFVFAMVVFLLGSALGGMSQTLWQLVAARIVQGVGGAMMTPVGRAIIVGSAPRDRLVSAMAWFTMPALIGPLIGPPIAGFILSFAEWRWIFYVNLPIGIAGIAAVLAFAPNLPPEDAGPFDSTGFVLTAVGVSALVVAGESLGVGLLSTPVEVGLAITALVTLTLYVRHARNTAKPILHVALLTRPSVRASILGGSLVRLGLGATPFLMPLLLQMALGWTPAKAGAVTIASSAGVLACKPFAAPLLKRFGFRPVLLATLLGTALLTAVPALYDAATPVWFMLVTLFAGGLVRSLQFTSTNSMTYANVEKSEVSQASTLSTVAQQIAMSLGVSFGGLLLHATRHGDGTLTAAQFVIPFIVIGATTLLAIPVYLRLPANTGAAIAGRTT